MQDETACGTLEEVLSDPSDDCMVRHEVIDGRRDALPHWGFIWVPLFQSLRFWNLVLIFVKDFV